ncbi:MAG: zinc ribbon domain-containing protein [Bacilli bacterium]|nr:zinc ribbon domain-containing protein [Bacilli bacterium]
MKKYCIHCGHENESSAKFCNECGKLCNEIDSAIIGLIKDDIEGNVIDSITEFIIAFIKHHIYGTILTLTVVTAVGANVVASHQAFPNTTNVIPTVLSSSNKIDNIDVKPFYIEFMKNGGYKSESTTLDMDRYSIIDLDGDGVEELLIAGDSASNRGFNDVIGYHYDMKSKSVSKSFLIHVYAGLFYTPSNNQIGYTSVRNTLSSGGMGIYKLENASLSYQFGVGYESSIFRGSENATYYIYHGNEKEEITKVEYNKYYDSMEQVSFDLITTLQ